MLTSCFYNSNIQRRRIREERSPHAMGSGVRGATGGWATCLCARPRLDVWLDKKPPGIWLKNGHHEARLRPLGSPGYRSEKMSACAALSASSSKSADISLHSSSSFISFCPFWATRKGSQTQIQKPREREDWCSVRYPPTHSNIGTNLLNQSFSHLVFS